MNLPRLHQALLATFLLVPGLAVAQTTTKTPPASSAAMPPAATSMTKPGTSATAAAPGHFASESAASASCPGDTVVWANPRSKALHVSGSRYYGKSKHGFYACEKQALSDGFHMTGSRKKHPKSA